MRPTRLCKTKYAPPRSSRSTPTGGRSTASISSPSRPKRRGRCLNDGRIRVPRDRIKGRGRISHVRARIVALVCLPSVILVCAFVGAAGADGGGRGEDVAAQGARLWTTILDRVVGVDAASGRKVLSVRTGSYGTQVAAAEKLVWQMQSWELTAV